MGGGAFSVRHLRVVHALEPRHGVDDLRDLGGAQIVELAVVALELRDDVILCGAGLHGDAASAVAGRQKLAVVAVGQAGDEVFLLVHLARRADAGAVAEALQEVHAVPHAACGRGSAGPQRALGEIVEATAPGVRGASTRPKLRAWLRVSVPLAKTFGVLASFSKDVLDGSAS
eukprot:scaffold907_cov247-Pinguiococcus_pyrenoidosus.AAC.16